jgi:K+-sensing histidine kinase KdpD
MGSFTAGLATGCLLGVAGTYLLLFLAAAFSQGRTSLFRVRSLPGTLLSLVGLGFIAAICQLLNIGNDASLLLFLLVVLAISKLEGLIGGLIASAVAGLILAWILPPPGTLLVKSSGDRLALALFLVIAALGSRVVGRRVGPAS